MQAGKNCCEVQLFPLRLLQFAIKNYLCKLNMKIFRTILVVVSILVTAVACQELPAYLTGEQVVARVGERELTATEVGSAVPQSLSTADSTAFAELYVNRWVKRMLKVQEAEVLFSSSAADIDKQVEEYRNSLLARKVDQYYVDRAIDTTFTDEQIQTYYEAHADDFLLDRTLVKGRIVRFPESYRRAQTLYSLMSSSREDKQRDFIEICTKNDFHLSDYTRQWVDYSQFLSELPVVSSMGNRLLKMGTVQNLRDNYSIYYLEITAILRPGERAPIERVEHTIRRILYNARQNEIIRSHEEDLYREAELREDVAIYSNETNRTE